MMTMKLTEQALQASLDKHREKLIERNGGWVVGEGVFSHGENLLQGLLGNKSYFHLLMLNATGQFPEDKLCQWLEASFICLSWPDPRIWCNTIGAYGGSARATVLASTVAGILGSDSSMYGTGFYPVLVKYLEEMLVLHKQGMSAEEIVDQEVAKTKGRVKMLGFARPIAKGDERVVEMLAYAKKLDFVNGEYITLALDIERYLLEKYDESLNIGGYIACFLLDQNFNAQQIYNLLAIYVNSGITACYQAELEKDEGHFLPMRCDDISYIGVQPRELPESA